MKKIIFIALMIGLILSASSIVLANDASMGRRGETVYPLEETDVRMVAEDIYVKYIETGIGHVTCEFVFKNSGDAKSVLMGFPAEEKIGSEAMTTVERVRLRDFTANLNGVPIEVNEIKGEDMTGEFSKYTSWYVFEVPFNAGETLTMTHEYDVSFTAYSTGQVQLSYVLITGATWGGEIGHTKVTFDLTGLKPWGITAYESPSLNSYTYKDDMLIFERSNYIPDFNLEVFISPYAIENYPGSLYLEDVDIERKQFFENAVNLEKEELIDAYNSLSYNEKFMETIYLNTRLGVSDKPYAPVAVELEYNGSRSFTTYVKDRNFDSNRTALFVMKNIDGNEIYRGEMTRSNNSSEYGTAAYSISIFDDKGQEAITSNIVNAIEITVSDAKEHESTAYFAYSTMSTYKTIIKSGIADDGENEFIDNPKTTASESAFYIGLLFLFIAIGLLIIKKVETDLYIQ